MANGDKFRTFLEGELEHRKKIKPSYSGRIFAKDLGVDFSFLAKLLNGSRAFTPLTLRRIGPNLGLSHEQIEVYQEDILRKQQAGRRTKTKRTRPWLKSVDPEQFTVISEWYYPAILVLMSLKKFDPRPVWISRQLGITVLEATQAIVQLENHGYFRRDEKGNCVVTDKQNTVQPSVDTTSFLRRYQKQTLLKSIAAIDEVPLSKRDHSCITIATTPKKIEQAKPLIRAFRRKLMRFLEDVESPNVVYDFATSFFPLTKEVAKEATKEANGQK